MWLLWITLLAPVQAAVVQGDCISADQALSQLADNLSPEAIVSCEGQPLQQYNANRYWGEQYSKNASVVVFPTCADDVSLTLQTLPHTPLGQDFAFVSGAHAMTNASSACGLVMDLTYLNHSSIISNFTKSDGSTTTAIMYQGGCTWGQVYNTTAGSGWTAVGARASDVGVGGFSTGGGIGFLAGAYGYAIDRLIAMDIVLLSGQQVRATADNEYSDLFWAFQGAGGQFGIVVAFYQEAAPEPTDCEIGFYIIDERDIDTVRQNTVTFFQDNRDPFSLMYYAPGYFPASLTAPSPSSYGLRTVITALRFNDPTNPQQADYNTTFSQLLSNIDTTNSQINTIPYSQTANLASPFFPYGYRRGFWGPQVPDIGVSVDLLENITTTFNEYITKLLANGGDPVSAIYILQYMFPGLNGHLPPSGASTAWPHARAGHQTLFSPAWNHARNDDLADEYVAKLNNLAYNMQAVKGMPLADYPNYISPDATGEKVWGANLGRLSEIKEKYDPRCLIHQGRVFASEGCVNMGLANAFST